MDKPFKSIDEQIAILDSRGVETDSDTAAALMREGYYSIVNGYKDPFIDRDAYASEIMGKAVLVSGDGDYFRTVSHLITMNKFEKIILPSHKNASSLYKRLTDEYRVYIDTPSARKKFGRK